MDSRRVGHDPRGNVGFFLWRRASAWLCVLAFCVPPLFFWVGSSRSQLGAVDLNTTRGCLSVLDPTPFVRAFTI